MSMEKLLNIKSGEHQIIDVLNKIHINKIAVYGEEANVILNQIINNECFLSLSLIGDRKELFELNLMNLIKPLEDYHKWKLCIFELKDNIRFPNIYWGHKYNDTENKIKVEFKSQDSKLTIGIFYEIENYKYF